MNVFDAFPDAVIADAWEIGRLRRATEIGDVFDAVRMCDVVVEEGVNVAAHRSPNADVVNCDTLLYAKPDQMPADDAAALSGYMWHNVKTGKHYEAVRVDVAKNQSNGKVEHFEFLLKPTEVADEC